MDVVGDLGHGLRLQQKLDEAVGVGRVRRILGDVQVVEPDQRTFLGDEERQFDVLLRFHRAGLGGGVVTGPGQRQADIAVGQAGEVIHRIELANVGADAQQQLLGRLEVGRRRAAWVLAQVLQGQRNDLGGRVHQGDAAVGEARDDLGVEQHGQRTDRRVGHARGDLVDVVGYPRAAPGIGRRVLQARVVALQVVDHLLIEVLPARQLLLVQCLEHAGADQRGDQRGVEHDQIVAGTAGEQFGLHGFVAIEGVVDDLDAGGLLEVGEGGFADVVGPVVQP
ncbi:hypothetical protein D9M71_513990 [compost metagenome]